MELTQEQEAFLSTPIREHTLSLRTMNSLELYQRAETLRDVVHLSEAELLKTKNFGRKSLNELLEYFDENGITGPVRAALARPQSQASEAFKVPPVRQCSFCKKSVSETKAFITSTCGKVHICLTCVEWCIQTLSRRGHTQIRLESDFIKQGIAAQRLKDSINAAVSNYEKETR